MYKKEKIILERSKNGVLFQKRRAGITLIIASAQRIGEVSAFLRVLSATGPRSFLVSIL